MKQYIKPEIDIKELEAWNYLLAGSDPQPPKVTFEPNEEYDEDDDFYAD